MPPVSAIRKKKHKKTQIQSDLRLILLFSSCLAFLRLFTCPAVFLCALTVGATGLISRPPLWSRLQSALPQRFNARSIALFLLPVRIYSPVPSSQDILTLQFHPQRHYPPKQDSRCYSILWTNLIVSAARKSAPSPGTGSNPSSPPSIVGSLTAPYFLFSARLLEITTRLLVTAPRLISPAIPPVTCSSLAWTAENDVVEGLWNSACVRCLGGGKLCC